MKLIACVALVMVLAAPAAVGAMQQTGPHRWTVGGITADRTSVNFIDMAEIQHNAGAVRAPLLLVPRQPTQMGAKLVAYSVIDVVFDCAARKMFFAEVVAFAPDGSIATNSSIALPVQILRPGSSFAVAADEACTGQPATSATPTFVDAGRAADYGRMLLNSPKSDATKRGA